MRGAVGVYDIGICDDGEFTCSEIEEMLLQYEKKHVVKLAVHIWNSGEQLCRYLKNSNLSLKEISEKCGYANQYYFSTSFKKWKGISPSSFREGKMPGST